MSIAYLGLGVNLGDRLGALSDAVRALDRTPHVDVQALSGVYETDPVGYDDQPDFLNMCVRVRAELSPEGLLGVCLGIESAFGRIRKIKNGPRVLDIDVLLYDDLRLDTPALILPHPRMWQRAFVLCPLAEVLAPDHPDLDRARSALKRCGTDGVRLYVAASRMREYNILGIDEEQ